MTWARERQIIYITILLAIFLGLASVVVYPYFNKAPSCFDNKQNGTETGPDCGGSCSLACSSQVDPISILWSRAFQVVPGRYNAVTYLENHNKNSAVEKVSYKFRFADKDNVYIGKREGVAFIPPAGRYAIFEPAIDVGNSIPVYTTFEFTEISKYTQVDIEKLNQLKIAVSGIKLENELSSPHLSAQLKNNSLFNIPEIGVVAILYDETGNAVSVSRTYLDQLSGGETKEINFTWPEPIVGKIIAQEIIPIYNVFMAKLK